jgi:hypothetical protein
MRPTRDLAGLVMVSFVAFGLSTASLVTRAASTAFFAISLMYALQGSSAWVRFFGSFELRPYAY